MQKVIGFIGYGNMARAMVRGLISSEIISAENIIASRKHISQKGRQKDELNIYITDNNLEVARKSDYIILATKPNIYKQILKKIKNEIKDNAVVIGIGAGISSKFLAKNLKPGTKYVRAMPNTPAMVGEGMTAISAANNLDKAELEDVLKIFNSLGRAEIIDESQMNGFTGLCGSSPAYIYMLIEAMADAAVLEGINRNQAYIMAAQSVMGAAKMVLETGEHPAQLKDNVCSPGGTTIEGVISLEQQGFRKVIMDAVRASARKSKEIER